MAPRNLITDVAWVLVGQADDARLASASPPSSSPSRPPSPWTCAAARRRREDRPARSRTTLSASTPWCCPVARPSVSTRLPGASVVARARPRFRHRRHTGAARLRRLDAVRPAQRRRQGLGTLSALPGPGLRGRLPGGRDVRARHRRCGLRRHHRQPQGRARLGLALTRDGHTVGALVAVNACGSVNLGHGPQFWAASFEVDGEFGGWASPPRAAAALTRSRKAGQGEYDHRHRRHRRGADQGRRPRGSRSSRRTGSPAPSTPPHHARRRYRVRGRDRPAGRSSTPSTRSRTRYRRRKRARTGGPRGVFEATALPGGPPSWRDSHSRGFCANNRGSR